MPEPADRHDTLGDTFRIDVTLEANRLRFATARLQTLERLELHLLELAVSQPEDDDAQRLELHADTVWRDARSIAAEHEAEAPPFRGEEGD